MKDITKKQMKVWYMKKESFRDFICFPERVKKSELEKTHAVVFEGEFDHLEDVFVYMNITFPATDQRSVIRGAGCGHTSMSVGDVVECEGKFFVTAREGFEELTD